MAENRSRNGTAGARRWSPLNASAVGAMGTVHGTRCGRRAHGPRGIRNVRASWMFTTRQTFARRCGECHERLAAVASDVEPSAGCQLSDWRTDLAGRFRELLSFPLVASSLKPTATRTTVYATTTPCLTECLLRAALGEREEAPPWG